MESVYIAAIAIGVIAALLLVALNRGRLAKLGVKVPGVTVSMENQPDVVPVPPGKRVDRNKMRRSRIRTSPSDATEIADNDMKDSDITVG